MCCDSWGHKKFPNKPSLGGRWIFGQSPKRRMRGKSGKTKGHKIEIVSVLCPFSVICFRVFGFSCNGVDSVPIFSSDCVKFALFLFGKFFKGNKFFHSKILLSGKKYAKSMPKSGAWQEKYKKIRENNRRRSPLFGAVNGT